MAKIDYWLTDEGLAMIEDWARAGLTLEDIAHNCGVHPSTLKDWKKNKSDISDALKKGKVADIIVKNALHKRAVGYECVEVKETYGTSGVLIERVVTAKHVPPDTTAAIFWLKNREPDVWRDRQEQIVSGKISTLSDEDRALIEKAGMLLDRDD